MIDALAVVADLATLDAHASAIERLGYEAKGEFGIEGRRDFRRAAAAHPHDMRACMDGKEGFIKDVEARAREWLATAPGTSAPSGSARMS